MTTSRTLLLAFLSLSASPGLAPAASGEVDPAALYSISTDGSSKKVAAGEKAKLVIAIQTKPGAHVSDEAPLKVELSGVNATPVKARLSHADSVAKKAPGQQFADPRFEAAFDAPKPGAAKMEAKVTVFICTENLCNKYEQTLSVPLEVTEKKKSL